MLAPRPLTAATRIDLLRHGETQGGSRFRGRGDDPLTEQGWAQMWSAVGAQPHRTAGAPPERGRWQGARAAVSEGVTFQTPPPQPSPARGEGDGESAACVAQVPQGRKGCEGKREGNRIGLRGRAGTGAWDLILASPLARCADFARALSRQEGIPLRLDARLQEMDFGAWEGQSAADLMERDAEALGRFWSDPLANTPPGAEPLTLFAARVLDLWSEILTRPEGERLLVISHGGVIRVILSQVLGRPLGRLLELEVGHASLNRLHIDRDAAGLHVTLAQDPPRP